MYEQVTRGIRVKAMPAFSSERSQPDASQYFWTYTIEIHNESQSTVQLRSRYWRITDQQGRVEEVRGRGVVGETPTLAPGESFKYTSGCPLSTPSGIMIGTYDMIDDAGKPFEVAIPAFSLDSPFTKRVMN
jgi:ApaG protein